MSGQPPHVTEWLRPLGVGELLDVAIKAYRARFTTMVKAVVVVIVPMVALGAMIQLSLLPHSTEVAPDPSGFGDPTMVAPAEVGDLWAIFAGSLLVALLGVAATQLATAASLKVASATYLGGEPRWHDSLRFAWRRLPALVWLTVLAVLFIFLAGGILALVAFLVESTPIRVLAVLTGVALIVYLSVVWSVAVPVVLLEGWRGRMALKRSRKLVAGRWWPTLAAIVLAYLLIIVLELGLSSFLFALVLGGASEVVTVLGESVISAASSTVTTPLLASVTTVLYFDLRVRKEGFDLELLARRVGIDPRAGTDAGPPGLVPDDLEDRPRGVPGEAAPAYGTAEWRAASSSFGAGRADQRPPEVTTLPPHQPVTLPEVEDRWSRAASWAVGFLASYAFLVVVQATLAYLADLTQLGDVAHAVVRILGTVVLAWALVRRRRWAWWAAVVASGLLALLTTVGAVAVSAVAAFGDPAEAEGLLPFGAVSAGLLAGIALSAIGAFCALVIGHQRRDDASSIQAPAAPSPLVGPVLLVVTVLASALGLSALRDSAQNLRASDNAAFEPVSPQAEPTYPDPGVSGTTTEPSSRPLGLGGRETQLPDGFGAIAVDDARRKVFVSSPTANVVSVLDFEGRLVGTIDGLAGPGALLVDGDRLLVASTTGGRIDVIDAASFKPLARWGEGALVKPGPLVKAGGRLWTSTGRCGDFETLLVSIDPASGATVVHPVIQELQYCMELATSPADPNLLLGFDSGLSPATVVRVDVSGASPTVVASRRQEELGNLRQLAVLPRGDRFVAASGSPYTFLEFRTEDLTESGIEYPADAYPTAAATTAAKGGMIAAGISTFDDPDIFVYRTGDPGQRLSTFAIQGSESQWLMSRGLAWAADGSSLFAVSGNSDGSNVRLHVFTT